MKKITKPKIIFFVILTTLFGYTLYWNSNYYIISHRWQATQGGEIGDFIFFPKPDDNDFIKENIIYLNGKPHCKIIFCFYKTLFLSDLDGKYKVKYIAK